ncbi:hypothetical protein [Sinorhizobium meliloti]|uniref:hypothetical protein n=1 Tax=Rhizobium meliloti TaxID=382 RepID=UPI000FDA5E46|nr:hypothetical protein [Sinorhizobium meliloti]RVK96134.1 hypothetical protein CN152_19780 [Sinorhizobium meliloti]RVN50945.1 hypothetical protein CN113_04060 [Sinorhizobium meliloti]
MADRIIQGDVIIVTGTGKIEARTAAADRPCRVQARVGDDGELKDIKCISDSCSGTCELREEQEGNTIHYSCDCVI